MEVFRCSTCACCRLVTPTPGYPVATDGWKLELLDTLCLDNFFTAEQARRILESIDYADSRVTAAARMFTRVTDTENWHRAVDVLTGAQQHELHAMLGVMSFFAPRNPTGHYKLALASQTHFMCAMRLLEIYRTQWANGLCRWPRSCCFVELVADGVQLDTNEPHKLSIPRGCSDLEVSFVDLSGTPPDVQPMHPSTFSALRSLLLNSPVRTRGLHGCLWRTACLCIQGQWRSHSAQALCLERCVYAQVLDIVGARRTLEDYRTKQAVTVLRHFEGFAFEGQLDRTQTLGDASKARPRVRDTANFIPFMRVVSLLFSITGAQLRRLLSDLPPSATPDAADALRCAALRSYLCICGTHAANLVACNACSCMLHGLCYRQRLHACCRRLAQHRTVTHKLIAVSRPSV